MEPEIRPEPTKAFSLVEMLGVLAVISILASVVAPLVFQTISNAKVVGAASTCSAMKSSVGSYFETYGKIGGRNGTDLGLAAGEKYEDYDLRVLVPEGLLSQPFDARIGNCRFGSAQGGSRLRVVNIRNNGGDQRPANSADAADRGAYDFDGRLPCNDVIGTMLVEAVLEDVGAEEAKDFNDRIDGPALGAATGQNDEVGIVKCWFATNGLAKVRVYVAHY